MDKKRLADIRKKGSYSSFRGRLSTFTALGYAACILVFVVALLGPFDRASNSGDVTFVVAFGACASLILIYLTQQALIILADIGDALIDARSERDSDSPR